MAEGIEIKFEGKEANKFFTDIIKNVKGVETKSNDYVVALSAIVFADVMDHFGKESGRKGKWKRWSPSYTKKMKKAGRSDNKILQFSGGLRQRFTPTNVRKVSGGLLWFNRAKTKKGFPYAFAHDEGGAKLPQRQFMWLSDPALKKIEAETLKFIER